MRGDRVFTKSRSEMVSHTLGHPPGVDENQCRPVRAYQSCEPVVNLFPLLVRRNSGDFTRGHLDREVEFTTPIDQDEMRRLAPRPHKELCDDVDWRHRGREPHAWNL